jgi:hypothetical protein
MIFKPRSPKVKRKANKLSVAKQQANDYGLIATSYHEASHTIVALGHLIMVDMVNIIDSQEGYTHYDIHNVDQAHDEKLKNILLMSEIKTFYAGLVGEKMYYKDICGSGKFPMHLKNGSSEDTSRASKLIRKYKLAEGGKNTFALKQEIREEVEKFLINHWEAVKTVAHALYKKKKLGPAELKYLLTRIPEDKDFWKEKFKTMKIIYDEKNDLSTKVVRSLISSKSNR